MKKYLLYFIALIFIPGHAEITINNLESPGRRRWAILIGIDDYAYLPKLSYCVNDVVWLSVVLKNQCRFQTDHIFLFVSDFDKIKSLSANEGPPLGPAFWEWFEKRARKPTKENIINLISNELPRLIKPGDLVLFHFSGHGYSQNEKGFIALIESSNERWDETCIEIPQLMAWIQDLSPGEIITIFDACRNNAAASRGDGRESVEPFNPALNRGFVIIPRGETELTAALFSCKVKQYSWEWPEKRHGFFSYFLARGLMGGAVDIEGKVTLNSLEAYLAEHVSQTVKREFSEEQIPWMERKGINPGALILSWPNITPPQVPNKELENTKILCVHPFINMEHSTELEYLSAGLAEGVSAHLKNANGIQVVERRQLMQIMGDRYGQDTAQFDETTLRSMGTLAGATYSVVGSYKNIPEKLSVDVRLVQNQTGILLCHLNFRSNDRQYLEAAIAYQIALKLDAKGPTPAPERQFPAFQKGPTWNDMAVKLMDAGNYTEAYSLFCQASDSHLDDVELHWNIEMCARLGGLGKRFLTRYLKLSETFPDNGMIYNYLGNGYLMLDPMDREGRARSAYEKALKINPTLTMPINNLSIIDFRQGNIQKAIDGFLGYLNKHPEDAAVWSNLGFAYLNLFVNGKEKTLDEGKIEDAFIHALKIDPTSERAYKGLGQFYQSIDRKDDALTSLERSLILNPDQNDVAKTVERLKWELGGESDNRLLFDDFETRSALFLNGTVEFVKKIKNMLEAKKFQEAAELAERLSEMHPFNIAVFELLEEAYKGLGDRDKVDLVRREIEFIRQLHER